MGMNIEYEDLKNIGCKSFHCPQLQKSPLLSQFKQYSSKDPLRSDYLSKMKKFYFKIKPY